MNRIIQPATLVQQKVLLTKPESILDNKIICWAQGIHIFHRAILSNTVVTSPVRLLSTFEMCLVQLRCALSITYPSDYEDSIEKIISIIFTIYYMLK